jgi:hypothetical protein
MDTYKIAELTAATAIQSNFSHYIIFGCGVFGLIWGIINIIEVSTVLDFKGLSLTNFSV